MTEPEKPIITQKRAVLDRSTPRHSSALWVYFNLKEDGLTNRTVALTWVDDEALGSPEQITVTIQPGDHLNPENP